MYVYKPKSLMANEFYFCDKCGKKILHKETMASLSSTHNKKYDLCEDCFKELVSLAGFNKCKYKDYKIEDGDVICYAGGTDESRS